MPDLTSTGGAGLSEALLAAAASAAAKASAGSSGTDMLRPGGPVVHELAQKAPLDTTYLGLALRNPVVASAGPLSLTVDSMRRLEDAGVGAVVMYSLFEEQLRHEQEHAERVEEAHEESFAEAMTYFPTIPYSNSGVTHHYLELLEGAANALSVPVIASVNGATRGGWVDVARRMQDAGASAVELNVYMVPGEVHTAGTDVEQHHLEILQGVKDAVGVPVAMKLSPFFSSFGHFAVELDRAGADGLVLFNRFIQPDFDVDTLEVVPGVELSTPFEARLPRTWIASLRGRVRASLAATTGVDTADDVVKYILAGADVVMSTSSLVRHGAGHARTLVDGLQSWLDRKQLTLDQARGMLAVPVDVPADAYQRAGYVAALERAKSVYGDLSR